MKYILSAIFTVSVLLPLQAQSEQKVITEHSNDFERGIIPIEDAIETEALRVSLDADLTGFVEGRICDECEVIKVNITPKTKVYDGRKELPLRKVTGRIGQPATVFFLIENREVSRIQW